jgi:RNA polymerase sigma-70 factor (ECF subfamily)
MNQTKKPSEILPTDPELPRRLKDLADSRTWKEFHDTYRNLLFGTARKEGLTDSEAEDVVQETLISAAKNIQEFEYDPSKSFKAWLLKMARWRSQDQIRKRLPVSKGRRQSDTQSARTGTIERVPAPTHLGLDAQWDQEGRKHVQAAALARIRNQVNPKHYQIFDAYVIKGWPTEEVMNTFKVTQANVFQIKKRIVTLLTAEVSRLQKRTASLDSLR